MLTLRWLWLITGHILVVIGIAGIILPLLPGTPLLILAAACYSKGSERFENWLLNHPKYGPVIRDWRAYRIIPIKAKIIALCALAFGLCFPLFIIEVPPLAKLSALVVMPTVGAFILTFPSKKKINQAK